MMENSPLEVPRKVEKNEARALMGEAVNEDPASLLACRSLLLRKKRRRGPQASEEL